jgi:hypothetical protein
MKDKGLFGGLFGVWLSSYIYGIIAGLTQCSCTLYTKMYALTAGIALFILAYIGWVKIEWRLIVMFLGSLVIIPLAILGLPYSSTLIVVEIILLFTVFMSRGTSLIVSGGALIGGVGVFIASLGSRSSIFVLLPLLYHSMTVTKAAYRVVNSNIYRRLFYVISILLVLLINSQPVFYLKMIVLLDVLVRILEDLTGLDKKLNIKIYGIIETLRSLIVLALAGLSQILFS